MLHVKSIKYGYAFDCDFFLKNGGEMFDLSGISIGDRVDLYTEISVVQADYINDMSHRGLTAHADRLGCDSSVIIPFRVVEKSHAFVWKRIGELSALSNSITIQAESGYWEDVFKWFYMRELPPWVDADELKESEEQYKKRGEAK